MNLKTTPKFHSHAQLNLIS